MSNRFRGYLPVVIDVETAGFNAQTDALLEIAAVTLTMDDDGNLLIDESYEFNVEPFAGAHLEKAALDFTGIDPYNPLRGAIPEEEALEKIFKPIRKAVKSHQCKRAILVGHNASFDHGFVTAAAERCDIKRNPFHPFSTFDTATLAGLAFGHTVLAKSCDLADIDFDGKQAHSALYDTMKTAPCRCGATSCRGWIVTIDELEQLR